MSAISTRVFEDAPAVRSHVPLLIGLVAPSGGGKTKSALRLADGIQRRVGGDIFGIDTEANRMLHYADDHVFRHVPFRAPFDSLSYLAAVEYCVKKGAKTIIIDSASHLHEGPGGTLEAHEAECERLMKSWNTTRDKVQMSAWQKPKSELRRFLNSVLQMNVNTIWCYRAKEKLKIIPGKNPVPMGFMPIAPDEMVYEMTVNCLLYPNSGGVPSWHPDEMGERAIVKLPHQFKELFKTAKPIDEDIGEQLAKWAAGNGRSLGTAPTVADYDACTNAAAFDALEKRRADLWKAIPTGDKPRVKAASDAAKLRLSKSTESATTAGNDRPASKTYDIPSAIEAIKATPDQTTCDATFRDVESYFDRIDEEVPVQIHGAYTDHTAALQSQLQL